METGGYAATAAGEELKLYNISRRKLTPKDVLVKILYSGICRSDQHHIDNDWGDSKYPLVPGHEIVGEVLQIGNAVTQVKVGDKVAIGNMTDSCQHCISCAKSAEQYCVNGGPTWTYNGRERVLDNGKRTLRPEGDRTFGGYSGKIVAQEKFVLKVPEELHNNLAGCAPLLCAGITMYYPLKEWKIGKEHRVGIAGIGGLGHLGLQFSKAVKAETVGITRTENKMNDIKRFGADDALLMDDNFMTALEAMDKIDMEKELTETERKALISQKDKLQYRGYFDLIICTIPVAHDPTPYLRLLKNGTGKLHVVGNMNDFPNLKGINFVFKGQHITSSNVGGLYDTKEMLQFCVDNGIIADVELISHENVNLAIDNLIANKVRYRYVMDMTTLN